MGRNRDAEVHCRVYHSLQSYCPRLQLDRIRLHAKCRPLPVCIQLTRVLKREYSVLPRYGMRYHGQMSLQIALLVALTQLIPEHTVQFLGVLKMRMKVRYLSPRPFFRVDSCR